MCLMHMNSNELKTRVSKYKYSTGFIGATGGWHYTQLEKFLVSDPDDVGFFDKNVTEVDESGYYGSKIDWNGKWTFDGSPSELLNYSSVYAGGVDWSAIKVDGPYVESLTIVEGKIWKDVEPGTYGQPLGDSVSKGFSLGLEYLQVMGSTFSPTYYGHGGVFVESTGTTVGEHTWKAPQAIRGLKADYVVFDDWQSPDIMSTGIMFWNDGISAPSSIYFHFSESPFSYLEMCGT